MPRILHYAPMRSARRQSRLGVVCLALTLVAAAGVAAPRLSPATAPLALAAAACGCFSVAGALLGRRARPGLPAAALLASAAVLIWHGHLLGVQYYDRFIRMLSALGR